jgi:hypothetical protein
MRGQARNGRLIRRHQAKAAADRPYVHLGEPGIEQREYRPAIRAADWPGTVIL